MKNKTYSLLIGGTGILISIFCGLLINMVNMEFIISVIKEWPKATLFILVVFIVISLCLLSYILKDAHTSKNEKKLKLDKNTKCNHSVLICDDKQSDLAYITDELSGYDYDFVTLKDISDYRLADSFEIVVSDIMGLGATHKNSTSVLNTIKEKYPYKIVIAMSAVPKPEDLHVDAFVIKDREKKYAREIRQRIKDYSEKLDDIDKHWLDTYNMLKAGNINSEIILKHKNNYYNFINNRP